MQGAFMDFRVFFSKRFKLLRTVHKLSGKTISDFLNIKSTSNVTYWEQGKNVPSIDLLYDIACLFGVSTDWLLGNIDYPYNESFIEKLETEMLANFTPNILPDVYLNHKDRVSNFALPVRANIIFVLNILYAFHCAFGRRLMPRAFEQSHYYRSVYENSSILKRESQKKKFEKLLHELLNNQSVFDLTNC